MLLAGRRCRVFILRTRGSYQAASPDTCRRKDSAHIHAGAIRRPMPDLAAPRQRERRQAANALPHLPRTIFASSLLVERLRTISGSAVESMEPSAVSAFRANFTAESDRAHLARCWARQGCGECLDQDACSWCPFVRPGPSQPRRDAADSRQDVAVSPTRTRSRCWRPHTTSTSAPILPSGGRSVRGRSAAASRPPRAWRPSPPSPPSLPPSLSSCASCSTSPPSGAASASPTDGGGVGATAGATPRQLPPPRSKARCCRIPGVPAPVTAGGKLGPAPEMPSGQEPRYPAIHPELTGGMIATSSASAITTLSAAPSSGTST